MKKHLLLTLSAVVMAALTSFAGVERSSATEYVDRPVATVSQKSFLRHTPKSQRVGAIRLDSDVRKAPVSRAAAAGRFAGLRTYPNIAWNEFSAAGVPSVLWQASVNVGPGFVADGKVYSFYYSVTQYGELQALGLNILNAENGSVLESLSYSVFDDKDKIVYGAAYDENEGMAYLMTSDGASGYQMQKFNPSTKKFSLVCKLPGSTAYPMAMAWHARNNGIYMISDAAYLERFNVSKGAFNKVGDTGLLIDEEEYGYPGAMVYSPKDEAFVALIEQGEAYTGFYSVDPLSGKATAISSLNNDSQWRILQCLDTTADPEAPEAPTAVSASFTGGSLSGSVELVLPTANVGGSALSGDVYAVVSEGLDVLSNSICAAPGSNVTVPLTLTAGSHTISVAAMQKTGDKTLTGPSAKVAVTVGSDVPGAPQNVVLSENNVSWTAPEAANGGFLDVSSLKYNVYINDVLVPGSPFSGTSAAIALPASGNIAKVAAVEAVAGEYISPRGISNVFVGRQPFGLPCQISPLGGNTDMDQSVINLVGILDVNGDERTWLYDQQSATGGFYYLCHSENAANDWLILPQMSFDRPGYYRLSMEVWASDHYFADKEKFEIGFGAEASATGMKVVSDVYTIEPKKNFEPYELNFYVEKAGNYYVGLHCVSEANHFRLYARNFLVESAQGTAAAPAGVSNLRAVAAGEGVLKANVSFKMPVTDVDGGSLDPSTVLTAEVSCGDARTTVSGVPGQEMSASVDAVQGDNTVVVRVIGEDGAVSPASSVELYVGVDIPAYVDLGKVISADNMTVTLKWSLSTTGITGGYVDPSACEYEIYRRSDSGSYIKVADAGKGASEWSYSVAPGSVQDIYQFGVRPVNDAGAPEAFSACDVMLGVLNELPMKELFRSQGEVVINNYDPIGIQNVADQYCSWTFADPKELDGGEPNATSTALVAYYQGYGQVTFPRFSTVGVDNVKISVSVLHGTLSSSEVIIAAVTPDNSFLPVSTVDLTQGTGWQTVAVSLPAECLGQGWAGLTVRCYNPTQLHMFMMDGYTIEVNKATGVALESVASPGKVRVGAECMVDVTLANYTSSDVAVPALNAVFKAENGMTTALQPVTGSATTIRRGEKAVVSYNFVAAPEDLGFGFVDVEISDPSNRDGDGVGKARVNVVRGYGNYVSDLSAIEADGGVKLSWSPLVLKETVVEDFEDFDTWERGERLGDFKNLDYDLQTTYGVSGVTYPGKYEPTAFEVFAGSEFPVAVMQAYGGDQYIAVFAPDSRATSPADDWLISPRVAGGSKVSMQILAPTNEFGEETVEILYSKNSDDTSEFESVGTFTTKDMKWQKIEVTLPGDARYFALHYTGFDTFCLLVDDITFSPYESAATVKEYKVYANGTLIGTVEGTEFAVDLPAGGAEYFVVPVLANSDGSESEAMRSNIVRVGMSGLEDIGVAITVSAVDGGIEISGFEGIAYIYGVDGSLVAAVDSKAAGTLVPVDSGIYMVSVGAKVYKMAVR